MKTNRQKNWGIRRKLQKWRIHVSPIVKQKHKLIREQNRAKKNKITNWKTKYHKSGLRFYKRLMQALYVRSPHTETK